jgi:hypothetical protein
MHGNKKSHVSSSKIIELNGTEVPFSKQLDPEKLHHDYNLARPLRQSAENMLKLIPSPNGVKIQDISLTSNSASSPSLISHQHNYPIQLENPKRNSQDIFKKQNTHQFQRDSHYLNRAPRHTIAHKSRFSPIPGVAELNAPSTKATSPVQTTGTPSKLSSSFVPAQLIASSSVSTTKPVNPKSMKEFSYTPEFPKKSEISSSLQAYEFKKLRSGSPVELYSHPVETQIYSTNSPSPQVSDNLSSSTPGLVYSRKPRPVDFKPYSIQDYRKIKHIQNVKLGGLGPSYLGTEEWERKMAKTRAMREYSDLLRSSGAGSVHNQDSHEGAGIECKSSNPAQRRFRGEVFEASS